MPNPTRDEIRQAAEQFVRMAAEGWNTRVLLDEVVRLSRALLSAFAREEKMRAVLKSARHYMWSVGGLSGHIKAQELDAAIKAIEEGRG